MRTGEKEVFQVLRVDFPNPNTISNAMFKRRRKV